MPATFDLLRPLIERRQRLERQRDACANIVGRSAHACARPGERYHVDRLILLRAYALSQRLNARIGELVAAQQAISAAAARVELETIHHRQTGRGRQFLAAALLDLRAIVTAIAH